MADPAAPPPAGPSGPVAAPPAGGPPTPDAGTSHWTRWLPMITALAVAVTPIGVATITSNVSVSSTNKDYVALAVSVLNSERSSPPMRTWATNVLEHLAPIPMSGAARSAFIAGDQNLTLTPQQSCARMSSPSASPSATATQAASMTSGVTR